MAFAVDWNPTVLANLCERTNFDFPQVSLSVTGNQLLFLLDRPGQGTPIKGDMSDRQVEALMNVSLTFSPDWRFVAEIRPALELF